VFGRYSELKHLEHDYRWLQFRKGMIFKNPSTYSGIPKTAIKEIFDHPVYPEGVLVIRPYEKGSVGWDIFYSEPQRKAYELEGQLRVLQNQLSNIMREKSWLLSTREGIDKTFLDFAETVQRTRTGMNVFGGWEGTAMIPPQPMYLGRPKPKPRLPTEQPPGAMPV
jgi:hypothetical protein